MGVNNSKAERKYMSRKRTSSAYDARSNKPHVLVTKTTAITDDYLLLTKREIGTGISGKVILCQNKKTKKKYALKRIKDSKSARREIELQWRASQNFMHIVQIKEVYENKIRNEPFFFMVMEFMEGGELFNKIRNRKSPFTEFEVAKIMRQIAMTVKHLHSMGIAHRDLKPENLLLATRSEKNFCVKLCDFGFAKEAHKGLMTPNYTPYYVAPEILRFEKYDISCDIWSLGVIMYILCCGYPPFYSTNGNKISPGMEARIKSGIFSFSSKDWMNISVQAKNLIRGMLETDTDKRFSIDDIMSSDWFTNHAELPKKQLESVNIIKKNDVWNEFRENMGNALTEMRINYDSDVKIKQLDEAKNKLYKRRQAKLSLKNENKINLSKVQESSPKSNDSATTSPKSNDSQVNSPENKPHNKEIKKSNSLPETMSAMTAIYYSSNLNDAND